MTMLDRMRRHKNWLKWSLVLVCLAFVVFYIPDFLSNPTTTDLAATNTLAVVEGREISGEEFLRTYQAQLQAYRAAYGSQMNDQILRQLGIDQQVLQQMVDERAALAEAARLDIRVTDAEVRERILILPAFQENGSFIGEQRYVQLLAAQRPPMTPAEFEEGIRSALMVDKLRTALTGWSGLASVAFGIVLAFVPPAGEDALLYEVKVGGGVAGFMVLGWWLAARRLAAYVDRIVKGAQPTDLPVEVVVRPELIVNLKTAQEIGVTIPPEVLKRADRVIK